MKTIEESSILALKFGINKKMTLKDYVLWLETEEGTKFVELHIDKPSREKNEHYQCLVFRENIIKSYALEMTDDKENISAYNIAIKIADILAKDMIRKDPQIRFYGYRIEHILSQPWSVIKKFGNIPQEIISFHEEAFNVISNSFKK